MWLLYSNLWCRTVSIRTTCLFSVKPKRRQHFMFHLKINNDFYFFLIFFTLALKSLAPNRSHFRATVRYILTHSDELRPWSIDHLVAKHSVSSLKREKRKVLDLALIGQLHRRCQLLRWRNLERRVLLELLGAAVLLVAFGKETL